MPTVTRALTSRSGGMRLRAAGQANESFKYSKKKVYQDHPTSGMKRDAANLYSIDSFEPGLGAIFTLTGAVACSGQTTRQLAPERRGDDRG